jgi:MoaA/NifB/PqqE/SkfB family radical SAM enzyme
LAWESLAAGPPAERRELTARVRALAATAASRGLAVHGPGPEAQPGRPPCPENVLKALVVSARGDVSPCVFSNLPAGAVHFPHGRPQPLRPLSFGNVQDDSLTAIWQKPEYAAFRRTFRRGGSDLPCRDCLKPTSLPAPSAGQEK